MAEYTDPYVAHTDLKQQTTHSTVVSDVHVGDHLFHLADTGHRAGGHVHHTTNSLLASLPLQTDTDKDMTILAKGCKYTPLPYP